MYLWLHIQSLVDVNMLVWPNFNSFNFKNLCNLERHEFKTPDDYIEMSKHVGVYVEFTHQQMHFFYLKNTLNFTLK